MEWLRCSKCKNLKQATEFYSCNNSRGHRYECKECEKEIREKNKEKMKEYHKRWYQKNKEKKLKQSNRWKKENKEKKRKTDKIYREKNKEHIKEWQKQYNKENAEKNKKQKREYYLKNREKILARCSKYNIERARNDINFRLKKNVSRAILSALNENKNRKRTEDLIGYPIAVMKDWLEQHFKDWMNWNNYGRICEGKETWQIDHIIPQTLYNFFDENEIKKCWNYRNLRPINAKENLIKYSKIPWDLIEEFEIEDLLPEKLLIDDFLGEEDETINKQINDKNFEDILIKFIEKIEHKGIVDEELKHKLINAATVFNKNEVINQMIKQIKVFKDYDEEKVNFPYKYYLDILVDKK
jgi:hypothetical protein